MVAEDLREPAADEAAAGLAEPAADQVTAEVPEPAADTASAPEDELTEPADTSVTSDDEPSELAPAEAAEFVTVEDAAGAESGEAAVQEAAVEELAEALGAVADERFDVDGLEDSGEAAVAVAASQLAAPPPGLDEAELIPALEAILLVVDEPVSEITLAEVLEVPAELVAGTLIDLSATYTRQNRGFDLRRAAGGWRLYTRAAYAPYVERFVLDGQQLRLTQASLETLAVVAYKQPVTRSRISAIRGVNCDGVIRTLVTRGMIEECGTEPESGAHLYRTTSLFLEKLGLDSVDQLPPLAPFLPDNVEEIADEQR
ncbi:SMC-Scp complex subunit ScpB [Catellatospora sp. IY07-71]|uniref:SMC-Scp complex subunit ScpB n=1 Tax=Catellatospora sp. IY07-71 TaxID=2728827 RepID=UPI001BB2F795|nr:SMC-Scp complex subunit ScpB [Catellatospora sp. IY07-71]